MGKLIIITGPQGCGKTTYAWKNYRGSNIIDYSGFELKEIQKSIKENNITVVCCLPMHYSELIPKDTNQYYQIITLNQNGNVAQICGRGFIGTDELKLKTNEQQLSFHRSEVERIEKLIEEENKLKDWERMVQIDRNFFLEFYTKTNDLINEYKSKITNPELIKLLEDECRESI